MPPAMIACTRSGLVPKVGGISADSRTPRRPLVPAPTKTIRPLLRSACVMISTPTAMRSFSRWTAASILRSSFSIPSTMSAAESLSMASVAGLMARWEATAISNGQACDQRPQEQAADTIIVVLSHEPSCRRRWSTPTWITCASSAGWRRTRSRATRAICAALAAFAAGAGRAGRGAGSARRSRRSSASSAAAGWRRDRSRARSPAIRGFYRFLVLDRRLDEQPGRRPAAAARVAGAAEVPVDRRSRHADRAAGRRRRRSACAIAR